jgi:CcmD family protein
MPRAAYLCGATALRGFLPQKTMEMPLNRHTRPKIGPLALLLLWLAIAPAWAQQPADSAAVRTSGKIAITQRDYRNSEIEMADAWRANGKIYVVVATLGAIMVGIVGYMALLDRRLGRLERQVRERRTQA